MASTLVTKAPALISLDDGNSSPSDCHPCPALKQNFGGHDFKAKRDELTFVTRWLKTHSTACYQRDYKSSSHDMINASPVAKTTWKCKQMAVQSNLNCSYCVDYEEP